MWIIFCFFFFSSRRRHTRCGRDWSSDVCSSDLYPFEKTVASGASEADIIEKIDIGGISLIRAGAKNFKDTVIISSVDQYAGFLDLLNQKDGETSLEDRKTYAGFAFHISSNYDTAIFNYFNADDSFLKISQANGKQLRYGENPHQKGFFFGDFDTMFDVLNGKELSYNNLLEIGRAHV